MREAGCQYLIWIGARVRRIKLYGVWKRKIENNKVLDQAQASEQFLASINLASNKAICLKTKKINKSNMYF
jgi:hypothetical protein